METASRLGWRPDPRDTRDYAASAVLGNVQSPVPFEAGGDIIEILDQGPAPTCVNNSVLANVREMHRRQGIVNPELGSRMFGHVCSKAQHGALLDPESGTFIRAGMKVLSEFGFCRESEYPYDVSKVAQQPPQSAFRNAFDQKTTEYRRIYETGTARVEAVKRAIAAGYKVSFGTLIGDDIRGGSQDNSVDVPTGSIAGGHAMLWSAYRGDAFKTANSWDNDWGDDGYLWMSADYVAWNETQDLWIVTKPPIYSGGAR